MHNRVPASALEHHVCGRVLRIEANDCDPEGAWPQRIAIAFDEVSAELARH